MLRQEGDGVRAKINCWEFNLCGREPGGDRVQELGVCPATTEQGCDGLNGGTNGGRICWAVAGTFCGGEVQCTEACRQRSCMACHFFDTVLHDEGDRVTMTRPDQDTWIGYRPQRPQPS